MKKADLGLIGLGVMGANLARNIASHGFFVSVFNRTTEKTKVFLSESRSDRLQGKEIMKDFVASLAVPRKIMIMVSAGDAVDQVIKELNPLLQKGDIIVDGGNSFYRDTIRREEELSKTGVHFVGCGISGGEYGALHGPSLMVGGSKKSFEVLKPIFETIAAKDFSGKPCVAHLGPNGAGHYVKMVHNGIEYALMQLIAEVYDVLRKVYKLSADQIADVFESFSHGELSSYLLEIAVQVLKKKDDLAPGFLVDHILPVAEENGTGRWTVMDALDRGIPVPMIAASVFARSISSSRVSFFFMPELLRLSNGWKKLSLQKLKTALRKAMKRGSFLAYYEGLNLISKASSDLHWKINLFEVTRIWQGGCIIRAKILSSLKDFPDGYHESRSTPLPANLIQAMRDYFGSHGYQRTDRKGIFHTDWQRL